MDRIYPIIFTQRDLVYGNGFVAGVTTRGRAIMECEEDDWWCYGVQPGALAASGSTPQEAYSSYQTALTSVLFDLASEARGLEQYSESVQRFFVQEDAVEMERWQAAVEALRANAAQPDAPFDKTPRLPANTTIFVHVEGLTGVHSVTAGTNILPEYAIPEAA